MHRRSIRLAAAALALILSPGGLGAGAARAGLVLSQAIVDIAPRVPTAQDIEVWNDGGDVAYVVAEPSEIVAAGLPSEHRDRIVDPGVGGLLVTPQRMILQPGERKLVRVAAIAPRGPADRIYRITIKPVAGPVTAKETALKLLVGYDVLAIYRPEVLDGRVTGVRSGKVLMLRNMGNTNVELYEGTQCVGAAAKAPATAGATAGSTVNRAACPPLPARRLYAGQSWRVDLPVDGPADYRVAVGGQSSVQHF